MEHRTQTSYGVHNVNVIGIGGATGCNNGSYPLSVPTSWTSYDEELISSYGRRNQFNSCEHTKVIVDHPNATFTYGASSAVSLPTKYCLWTLQGWHNNGAEAALLSHMEDNIPQFDLGNLSAQAVDTMWPEVENRMGESAINSLIEIPSIKRLPGQLKRITRRSWYAAIQAATRRHKGWALKQLLQSAANTNLIYQYGIKTLVQDWEGLTQAVSAARGDVNRLLANADRHLVSHCTIGFPKQETVVRYDAPDTARRGTFNDPRDDRNYNIMTSDIRYTATMRYSYSIPEWMRKEALTLGALDAVGISLNPRIIWDAIPWSFVVDWFAKVGDFVDQLNWRNLDPRVTIHSFGHSVRYLQEGNCEIAFLKGVEPSGRSRIVDVRKTYYKRSPFVPNTYQTLMFGGLSTYKSIMSASLLASKIK